MPISFHRRNAEYALLLMLIVPQSAYYTHGAAEVHLDAGIEGKGGEGCMGVIWRA